MNAVKRKNQIDVDAVVSNQCYNNEMKKNVIHAKTTTLFFSAFDRKIVHKLKHQCQRTKKK